MGSSLGEPGGRGARPDRPVRLVIEKPAGTFREKRRTAVRRFPGARPPAAARQARATSSKALGSLIISVMSGYIAIRAAPRARR
ncbi:hypothetical protein GCM10018953_40320 [Streptosporangium nondiastaticum]